MFLGEAAGSGEFKRYRGSQRARLLPAKKESSASMLQAIRTIISARHAAEQSPDNPEIQYHLASVLAETGEIGEVGVIIDELPSSEQPFPSRSAIEHLVKSL